MREASHKSSHVVRFHWYDGSRVGNSTETDSRLVAAGNGELVVIAEGMGFLLGLTKMF